MELKRVPSKLYYCVEKELTIPEIPEFAENNSEALYMDAQSKKMGITGHMEFIYLNCSGDPNNPFQLIIAVSVDEKKPSQNNFFFLETMPFDCISTDYIGPMMNIGKAWEALADQVLNEGYKLSNQGREIYKEWVSHESEKNITELQMGIVARKIN